MYQILQPLHSYLAYFVLAGLVISVVVVLMNNGKPFTDRERKLSLLGLIPAHLQWVFGVILYFVSPLGINSATAGFMKNSSLRLYVMEHPLMMVIAVVLITVGYSRAKRMIGSDKGNKSILIFYAIGLVLILSRIPWGNWPG
ncbi:MAG: hypothetical protein EOP53_06360 [Sphingobacteriales bacterium]|nr:MAG: hypothetical protein EOP53_06360 [Sphingobacteriales bacterium]